MSRAVLGHDVMPITRMMFRTDGPRIAASTIASGRNGITRNHSVSRMRIALRSAAEEAGEDADHGADDDRDQRRREADEQADARAPDELRPARCGRGCRCRAARTPTGVAHVGLSIVLTASQLVVVRRARARRAPSRRSATRTPRPIIPGRWRRYCAQARASARRRRCHAMRRAGRGDRCSCRPHPRIEVARRAGRRRG